MPRDAVSRTAYVGTVGINGLTIDKCRRAQVCSQIISIVLFINCIEWNKMFVRCNCFILIYGHEN